MNTVKVKICGIRTLDAAQAAVDAGVDFLGFNFVPKSKRYIAPSKAKKIIETVKGRVNIVGVFQNAPLEEVNKIAEDLPLGFVQLHGAESPEYILDVKANVIKVFSLVTAGTMLRYSVSLYLLDRKKQGEGRMVNDKKAARLAKRFPLVFSGGLTPKNVSDVIKIVRPVMVDVASGVETDGKQDLKKIREFIRRAKEVT